MSAEGELDRRVGNIIRVGTIAELDAANARVKIKLDDELTTDWLPWIAGRAGATRNWSAPRTGEQVAVMSPSGELSMGVVLPGIYQDDHPAPAASQDQEHTVYPDGTTVDYNSATNTLTVNVAGNGNVIVNCKVATVTAETSVTIDTPETTVTGNLTIGKSLTMGANGESATITGSVAITGPSLTHNGKNIGSTHQHSGIQPGGSNTAAPI